MKEVEQRVCGEEQVLLIGSPMCRAFSTFIELTQAGKSSEVSRKNLAEQCVTSRDLACADESGRCEHEVRDDSSDEDVRVHAADAHED